jgi:hypothetical protein
LIVLCGHSMTRPPLYLNPGSAPGSRSCCLHPSARQCGNSSPWLVLTRGGRRRRHLDGLLQRRKLFGHTFSFLVSLQQRVFHRLMMSCVCVQPHCSWHLAMMWCWACKPSKLLLNETRATHVLEKKRTNVTIMFHGQRPDAWQPTLAPIQNFSLQGHILHAHHHGISRAGRPLDVYRDV